MTGLRRHRQFPRPQERLPETPEHRQIGMKRDPFQATDAKRSEAIVQLQVTKRPLYGSAATVKVPEALAVAKDARKEAPADADGAGLADSPERPGAG